MQLHWWKNKRKNQAARNARKEQERKRRFLPTFEALENRFLLSTTTIHVTDFNDDGTTASLRAAINQANTNSTVANPYVIQLDSGTYTIASGGANFDVTAKKLTINQFSGGTTFIDAQHHDRVFDVETNANVTFDHVTIQNGTTTGAGGGILTNPGSIVKLTNATVQNNTANGDGGGIAAGYGSGGAIGTLILTNTIIGGLSGGTNTSHGDGGGIALNHETVTITGSTIASNHADGFGGGIYVGGAASTGPSTVTIDNSTISKNTSGFSGGAGKGGGIYVASGDTVTIQNNSVIGGASGGNTALAFSGGSASGGGIFATGTAKVTVDHSTVSNNTAQSSSSFSGGSGGQGGGIFKTGAAMVQIQNSSFITNNTAEGSFSGGQGGQGGGIFAVGASGGSVTITSSTVNNNHAGSGFSDGAGQGAGIYLSHEKLTVSGGTITGNIAEASGFGNDGAQGAGVFADGSGSNLDVNGHSLIDHNVAKAVGSGIGQGGGFYLGASDVLKLTNSTVGSSGGGNEAGDPSFSGGVGQGAGIFAQGGPAVVATVNIHGAVASSTGSVTITDSLIVGNIAHGASGGLGGKGGGAFFSNEKVTITHTTFDHNGAEGGGLGSSSGGGQGGGFFADGAGSNITINGNPTGGSFFTNNFAEASNVSGGGGGEGGAFWMGFDDVVKMSNTTVGGLSGGRNIANGADHSGGGGEGGGIYAEGSLGKKTAVVASGGSLTIVDSSILGNTAEDSFSGGAGRGGGMFLSAELATITHTTIKNNIAEGSKFNGGQGGGMFADGTGSNITINNNNGGGSTISANTAAASGSSGGGQGGGAWMGRFDILTLTNSTVGGTAAGDGNTARGNSSGGFGEGGGIWALGDGISGGSSITMMGSKIIGNTAEGSKNNGGGGGQGGGMYMMAEVANITGTTISGNIAGGNISSTGGGGGKGGGIYAGVAGSSITVSGGSSIKANTAQGSANSGGGGGLGGGIYIDTDDILVLRNSTVGGTTAADGNIAGSGGSFSGGGQGGGIWARGNGISGGTPHLTIADSNIRFNIAQGTGSAGGEGGGLGITRESASISNSTIANNQAGAMGGGIYTGCAAPGGTSLSLLNSTLSDNQAGFSGGSGGFGQGGGLFLGTGDTARLVFDTVAFNKANEGAGIYNQGFSGGSVHLWNTIVGDNLTFSGGASDLFGHSGGFVSDGHNLIRVVPIGGIYVPGTGDILGSPATPQATGLNAALALNSSLNNTYTHALNTGSKALKNGDPAALPLVNSKDQRGITRDATHPNIGAYEQSGSHD